MAPGTAKGCSGSLSRHNPGKQLYTATKIPPKNFKWPSLREFTLDDCFPPDHIEEYVHSSLKNAGLETLRPDAVPHLGGRLGAGRPLGEEAG